MIPTPANDNQDPQFLPAPWWRLLLAVSIILFVGWPSSSQAFNEQAAYNSGTHMGRAEFMAQSCSDLTLNDKFTTIAEIIFKDKYPSSWQRGYALGLADALSTKRQNNTEIFCATSALLYGPSGMNVKGLLIRK